MRRSLAQGLAAVVFWAAVLAVKWLFWGPPSWHLILLLGMITLAGVLGVQIEELEEGLQEIKDRLREIQSLVETGRGTS
jgi:hypothetical protein